MSLQFSLNEDGAWLLGGHLLHPSKDPLSAARAGELGDLLDEAQPEDLLVLAGCGLGWHIQAVLDAPHSPHLIVYEPDAARIADMHKHGPWLPDLELATDEEGLAEALGRHLVYGQIKRVALFSPPAYRQALPEMVQAARTLVDHTVARSKADALTRSLKTGLWLEHLEKNIKWWPILPDVALMDDILRGIPAIVIGAGPSLDQSLSDLAGITARALVLAAASALNPLAKVGTSPHIAFALEAGDESRQFTDVDHSQTLLATASTSHPNHFLNWTGPRSLFHLWPWPAALSGLGKALPCGGHVTSAAFSLAVLWGCDPIILVGQDLAYTHGRIHAAGRPGGEDEVRPEIIEVPALDGGVAQTSPVMLSYILWYEEAASTLRKSQRRIINATAAGAYLPGFEHKPLQEVLEDLPPFSEDLKVVVEGVSRLPRPTASFLIQRMAQARFELQAALERLEQEDLAAARSSVRKGSVAAVALEDIRSSENRDLAIASLKRMIETLWNMRQELHTSIGFVQERD
ncbi:MAG: motility associated factor glycosyltransferase family protein [Deltaproteobacteria bacterium]|nr:motility associated factor glycosyltransferase family protein [Deltaproteobacteria bacterium]